MFLNVDFSYAILERVYLVNNWITLLYVVSIVH